MVQSVPRASARRCVDRAEWYLARVDALLVAAAQPRLDADDRLLCQAMLRELKGRFGIDKTTPLAAREATPALVHYHAAMREAGARLTMATDTVPTPARWNGPLQGCRSDLVAYLADAERVHPAAAH